MYALTSQELTSLKNRSIASGWHNLPIDGANKRAYFRHNGNSIELKSYDTIVFEFDTTTGEFIRRWNGYSATTLKHVQMFVCFINNMPYTRNSTFGKKNWEQMYVA